jgi:hypothetical protein
MGQRATTDFDDTHAHGNEILNIWESTGVLVYYQQDKDWFYRTEERRWISLNDNSSWRRMAKKAARSKNPFCTLLSFADRHPKFTLHCKTFAKPVQSVIES